MTPLSITGTTLVVAALAVPASAVTELSGTVTREEDGTTIQNVNICVTRVSVAAGTPDGDAIPVEWTAATDEFGFYRFDLDEALPGMDRLLVFTRQADVFGELYPDVDSRGVTPKGADIVEPGVVELDLTVAAVTGIDFVVASNQARLMVPMSDGVRLDTRWHLPSRRPGMEWPVLLLRTPYQLFGGDSLFLENDYALVNQNTRGRFDSEGEDTVYDSDGWVAHQDGYDTVEWIDAQAWSEDGKVCTRGKSAPGITSYLAAGTTPAALACVFAEVAGANHYDDYYYPGGVFRKYMIETWMEDNGSLHKLSEVKAHPNEDTYWNDRSLLLEPRLSMVEVPMLHYSGWYDIVSQGTIDLFKALHEGGSAGARRNQKLVVGPWDHGTSYGYPSVGELHYPQNAVFDARGMALDWFEFWLKGRDNGIMDTPPVRAYVMGPGGSIPGGADPDDPGNFWRTSATWPPASTETAYYIHNNGLLSTDPPSSSSADTSYVTDPANPVPTVGGNNLFSDENMLIGPRDQSSVDGRADVLVWETRRLQDPIEVSGSIKFILYGSSDQPDTDWVVKLEDVYPDGRIMLVGDMPLMARHRIDLDREDLLTPGQIYEFTIDLWDTSITFGDRHKIRVAIQSSNYPRFEVNPQTGEPFDQHTTTNVATNVVHHDVSNLSRLMLPVVDPVAVEGCAATEHVTGLAVDRLAGDEVRLTWNGVADACHAQYRVYAGTVGPEWPWIVRRPVVETTATQVDVTDEGVFWQVVSEGTDGGNGPHGVP